MNAAGVVFAVAAVAGALDLPHFQTLVANGSISQDEFDGTQSNLKSALTTLRNTPQDKIEALVAQSDEDLTAYLQKFNAMGSGASIEKFRLAQIMSGLAVSIVAKAGVKG